MNTPEQIKKLAFVANGRYDAEAACAQLEAKYSGVPVDEADIIVGQIAAKLPSPTIATARAARKIGRRGRARAFAWRPGAVGETMSIQARARMTR